MKHSGLGAAVSVVLTLLTLSGCATTSSIDLGPGSTLGQGGLKATRQLQAAAQPSVSTYSAYVASIAADPEKRKALSTALDQDFASTMAACNQVFVGFERQANSFRWTAFWIAMVGTVAGAIVVPALTAAGAEAHKIAIAAVGGLAGAANSAQGVLNDQGLSAAETVKARDDLRKSFNDALHDYLTAGSDDTKRKTSLEAAAAACVSYAIQSPTTKVKSGS
jgi:hypothetical protein